MPGRGETSCLWQPACSSPGPRFRLGLAGPASRSEDMGSARGESSAKARPSRSAPLQSARAKPSELAYWPPGCRLLSRLALWQARRESRLHRHSACSGRTDRRRASRARRARSSERTGYVSSHNPHHNPANFAAQPASRQCTRHPQAKCPTSKTYGLAVGYISPSRKPPRGLAIRFTRVLGVELSARWIATCHSRWVSRLLCSLWVLVAPSDQLGGAAEVREALGRQAHAEHGDQRLRPAVEEVAPAVVDPDLASRRLPFGLMEEASLAAVFSSQAMPCRGMRPASLIGEPGVSLADRASRATCGADC